jgi:hypothetical protein
MEAANVTVTAAKKEAVSVPRAPVACQCPRRGERAEGSRGQRHSLNS